MKCAKTLVVISAVLMVVSLTPARGGANSSAAAKPALVIASLEHSFGDVKAGTPLSYTFEVKNQGEANLEIQNVSPSCGCTTSKFDNAVAPGKSGNITLAIEKTDGYKGELTKTATLYSNDPEHQTFVLTLRANFISK